MLVLSRKIGEEILIGNDVKVVINRISGNRVTVGIQAPDHVHIMRGELEPLAHQFEESLEQETETLAAAV